MPHIKYRSFDHAVAGRGKYGYFESLSYKNKIGLLLARTQVMPSKNEFSWPVELTLRLTIHSYEDMDLFLDAAMDAFDRMRGENAGAELSAPSSIKPFR